MSLYFTTKSRQKLISFDNHQTVAVFNGGMLVMKGGEVLGTLPLIFCRQKECYTKTLPTY